MGTLTIVIAVATTAVSMLEVNGSSTGRLSGGIPVWKAWELPVVRMEGQ